MKTKLEMAHDWYMKHSESPSFMYTEVEQAWQYADAMQAEADKREHVHKFVADRPCECGVTMEQVVRDSPEYNDWEEIR